MNKKIQRIKEKFDQLKLFVSSDVWEEDEKNHGKWNGIFIRMLKTILMAIHGFMSGRLQIRASALTYYSTLSIVPIMAILMGVSQGLGMRKLIETTFMSNFPGQVNIFSQIISFSEKSLEITSKGSEKIMGIGIVLFIIAIFNIFSHTEKLFNEIWQVKKVRSIVRRFTDYMCLMLILPVFIIVSSGIAIFAQTQLKGLASSLSISGAVLSPVAIFVFHVAPFVLSWLIFTTAYLWLPNMRVKFFPALIAGIVAGTAFQLFQMIYISGQIWVSRYGAIYGSFAALPLFMLWMQVSWTIVLIGAELSFSIQNLSDFDFERKISKLSFNFQRRFALLITCCVVKQFDQEKPPLSSKEIAEKVQIPIRLVNEMAQKLVEAGVLSEVLLEDDSGFQPASDINKLTLSKVCELYEARGLDKFRLVQSKDHEHLQAHLNAIQEDMRGAVSNVLIKDL